MKVAQDCSYVAVHASKVDDLKKVNVFTFDKEEPVSLSGKLHPEQMAESEAMFQDFWKSFIKTLTIRERLNPKLQRQHMPVRFWKYLTEKQEYNQ